MKLTRILVVCLAAMLMAGEVDAQVSVRRTSRTTEQTPAKRPKKEPKKSSDNAASSSNERSESKPSLKAQNSNKSQTASNKSGNPVAAKRTTPSKKEPATVVNMEGKTLRQQAFDDYQKESAEETPWQHIVYRQLDLRKEANASLYFPVEPMNGLTNLFRVIIEAFSKGELKAYEYLDGREVFSEKFLVKPKDIFDKFEIYYQTKPATQRGGEEILEVNESDVPSANVLSYYIKERWEFDQKHSRYQARVLCICPVLHQSGGFSDETVPYPMFWINYEDLRPFLRDHLIISQGMNTAARYTMEEFFSLGQYQGDIYKEQNLRGLSLKQIVGDNPDSLKMVQEKLDNDLRAFEDSIWVKDPEPEIVVDKRAARAEKTAIRKNTANSQSVSSDRSTKINRRTKENVDMEAVAEEKEAKTTTHKSVRR